MKKYIELIYRIAFIIISGISLLMHFDLNDKNYNIHEFSFFTVQSNIFCFTVMVIILGKYLCKKDICGTWMMYFKGMATSAILSTFLVYHFAESCNKYPLMTIGVFGIPNKDLFAHYLTPTMFILDWLIFQPKGYYRWRHIVTWLAFPFIYFTEFITRCTFNSASAFNCVEKFPYFFLNYEKLGIGQFCNYILILAVIMLAENTLIVMLDKFMFKHKQLKK